MVDVSLYGLFLPVAAQKVHINLNASYQSSHRITYNVNEDVYKMTAIIVFTWPMFLPQQRKDTTTLALIFEKKKILVQSNPITLPPSSTTTLKPASKTFQYLSKNVQIKLDKIRH